MAARKPNRLATYDYSQNGAYFVTICAHDRKMLFGRVGAIHESPAVLCQLSECGQIVRSVIESIPARFPEISVENYVVMPNHLHLILLIAGEERAIRESPLREKRSLLSKAVGYLKMNSSKMIHRTMPDIAVWQRSYHDHVIRTRQEYLTIWQYIDENPLRWELDGYYSK